MISTSEARANHRWAYETFSDAEVGDRRRTSRLIALAAGIAARPAGTITEVFDASADREGAYRLLSNDAIDSAAIRRAICETTARHCASLAKIYVPVDGSSLSLVDRTSSRGLGGVGAWKDHGKGLQVITAIAVDGDGVPIGVADQTWWARIERSPRQRCSRRKLADKETRFVVSTVENALRRLCEACPNTRVIGVMDRGFDCWPVLQQARDPSVHFIVRAQHDRRLANGPKGGRRYLRSTLASQPVFGHYSLEVPERTGRAARTARMQVKTARVTLELRVTKKRCEYVELNAVLAQEIGRPRGAGLSWTLLTTEPIDSLGDVLDIVRAYTFRWRIEEMHRAWKRGGGNVEDTQLRSREAIIKWATLHCAVAIRAVRLAQLARTHPHLPATHEFSQTEIDAAITLRKKSTAFNRGDVPCLHDVIRMIADLGGYTGKSSGGPPGPTVLARGLERLAIAADMLEALRK